MHQHPLHAQRIGHQTSVLAASATKTLQGVARHVVAARHRNFFDRVGHLLHRDLHKTFGQALGALAHLRGQIGKTRPHHRCVQRLVAGRAKHRRKPLRLQLAQQHIGVGHRERAAAPVAGRAGVGTGAVRPHPQAGAVELQHRATACRHRVDGHHRRAQAHTGHLGFKLALKSAGKVRHVGGRAAHVKADHPLAARLLRGARHADNAAGRAGQNRVLASKGLRIGQPARGLHEQQRHARHLGRHLVHIAAQDRREVGVHHRGVAPAHQLHQRAGGVAAADLGKAHLGRNAGRRLFVRGVAVAVHEDNRHAAQASVERGPQPLTQVRFVQWQQHLAMGAGALLRLHHPLVQQLRQHNAALKQTRSVLVSDAQRVAKPPRGHQQRGLALALQQRIGGHRGAHAHRRHPIERHRLAIGQAQQVPNARHRRVAVALGRVGQELVRQQLAVGRARHDVGEGAAAVNPETPAGVARLGTR